MQKLPDEQLRWKESGRKELLKTRVLTVTERESVSPDGQTGQYVVLEAPDWVITIQEIRKNLRLINFLL